MLVTAVKKPRTGSADPSEYVQSLDRGLAVIRAFDAEHRSLTLSEVAERTQLTRAAARRFLLTLQSLRYVQSNGRQFSLLPRVLELGYAFLSSNGIPEIAQRHLEQLAQELEEACSASVLDGDEIVYVSRAATKRIMTTALAVGTRLPAYCASMGRVLLSGLEPDDLESYLARVTLEPLTPKTVRTPELLRAKIAEARKQGWCLIDQEIELGLRSISVPVRDRSGKVILAINCGVHATRISVSILQRSFLPRLKATAEQIEQNIRILN